MENKMFRDFDFRFWRVDGYFSTRPETNMIGVLIERRSATVTMHVGLLLVAVMISVDLGSKRAAKRAANLAAKG